MSLTPWLVILSLSLVACSGSKSAQKVDEETPQIELSDADEFIENPSDEVVPEANGDGTVEVAEPAVESTDIAVSEVVEDPMVTETEAEPVVEEAAVVAAPEVMTEPMVETSSNFQAGSMMEYKVQKNETLMMIAFKLYGDYGKWKELASYNRDALKGNTNISNGMTLKYMAPAQEFVWNPQGLPYLIRTGDTLGGISTNVYATPKKWKLIWDNNRPLIKDPNKIFAGFTIYYLENGREVAAEI